MATSTRVVKACALAAILAAVPLLGACSDSKKNTSGSSSVTAPSNVPTKANVCKPVADQTLVVLADDKHSQASDNIIPAVNKRSPRLRSPTR